MPKVVVGEGVAIGAMSCVNCDDKEWGIYVGIPVKFLKKRSKDLKKQKLIY